MANYTLLRYGDRLPTVGVLQKLLNRSGAKLRVDGVFGPRTREAVMAFQASRRLYRDGGVGESTWSRLVFSDRLPIVDCVDVFDPDLYAGDARNIMRVGGQPILIGGMSRGVLQAAQQITAAARDVFLLRFIGHGRSGLQGVAVGKGGWDEVRGGKKIWHSFGEQKSSLHWVNAPQIHTLGIRCVLGPHANVELHGCHVAAGARGHSFLAALANSLGVPVSAGIGGQQATFASTDRPSPRCLRVRR